MSYAPCGYCPFCGAPGMTRERRPNGDDRCDNGHVYPSRQAQPNPRADLAKLRAAVRDVACEMQGTIDTIDHDRQEWTHAYRVDAWRERLKSALGEGGTDTTQKDCP